MLFYYFKNKKDLFHFLVSYSVDFLIKGYLDQIDGKEQDIIKRFRFASQLKMNAFTEFPGIFNFMGTVLLIEENHLPKQLTAEIDRLRQLGYDKLYKNIDFSLFRNDIDSEKAFQLIRWSIDGYQNDLLNKLKGRKLSSVDLSPYWKEFDEYLEILKISYYK